MIRTTWRSWARALKQNTYALYLAARHPRVPVMAKIMATLVAAYALSPIDLIPDFVPVVTLMTWSCYLWASLWR
jgi:uncharacterized membrane protein YkvA (DUF1232 family)